MYSKNNKKMIIQKEQEKINYYGIKKFNVGTASVLIAAGFAFLGGGSALASNDASATITNTETVNNNVTVNKEEVSTTTPAKANKTNLSAAIARVQEAIAKAGVSEKTASVIEDAKVEKGIIEIELIRLNQEEFAYENLQKLPPIIDFHIKDNGIGFDEKNFESFNFAHSSYKMDRGGKGIGRITWLRAFDKAIIESQFKRGRFIQKKDFYF